MTYTKAFDIVDAGEGRWDIQLHETFLVAGRVWRTAAGFLLWDWADRQLGTFPSLADALRTLFSIQPRDRLV